MPQLNTAKGARRHPEKRKNPDRPQPRRPDWLRVKAPVSAAYAETRQLMRDLNLVTVCEEAACPNIGECWAQKHATMMILGSVCTRACAFCNVATGRPDALDLDEPENVAKRLLRLACAMLSLPRLTVMILPMAALPILPARSNSSASIPLVQQSKFSPPIFFARRARSRWLSLPPGCVQSQYGNCAAPLPLNPARRPLFPLAVDPAAGEGARSNDLYQIRDNGWSW